MGADRNDGRADGNSRPSRAVAALGIFAMTEPKTTDYTSKICCGILMIAAACNSVDHDAWLAAGVLTAFGTIQIFDGLLSWRKS